ncbi:MAG: lipopolysaccharide biosynthesis protein [Propionibacteriaceae bacterium]|nr:lipopolysaccharide biosynthesis protein [Propionibacteriaceae bacterium]
MPVGKSVLITLTGQAAKFTVQMTSTILLARLLSPVDFGKYALVAAILGVGFLISDFGLSTATIQAKNITNKQQSNSFWITLGIGMILSAIACMTSGPISQIFADPTLSKLTWTLSINFIIRGALSQYIARLTRDSKYTQLALCDISSITLGLGVGAITAILGLGVMALVFQTLTISLTQLIISMACCHWVPSLPHRAPMRGLLTFAGGAFGVQALTYATSNLDDIVLGWAHGPAQVGFYNKGYQLFRMPLQQVISPLTRVALPTLARSQDNSARLGTAMTAIQSGIASVIGAMFTSLAVLSTPVTEALFGQSWTTAAGPLSILCVGGIFQAIGYIYYWGFLAIGKTSTQLSYTLATRIIMALGIIILGCRGIIEMAIVVSASLALNWAVIAFLAWPRTGCEWRVLAKRGIQALTIHCIAGGIALIVDHFALKHLTAMLEIVFGLTLMCLLYGLILLCKRSIRTEILAAVAMFRGGLK